MNIAVPRAEHVDHDLFQVAKPLLLLGWSGPAALAARCALEQTLRTFAESRGVEPSYKSGITAIADALEKHNALPRRFPRRAGVLGVRLNRVAHGRPIGLRDAVQLVEDVEAYIDELSQL